MPTYVAPRPAFTTAKTGAAMQMIPQITTFQTAPALVLLSNPPPCVMPATLPAHGVGVRPSGGLRQAASARASARSASVRTLRSTAMPSITQPSTCRSGVVGAWPNTPPMSDDAAIAPM